LISSFGLCILTWLEHDRTVRPSFVLATYLLLCTALDLARLRTLWMLELPAVVPAIASCSFALRIAMLLLESVSKRPILTADSGRYSRAETSSTLSRSIFGWLAPLFMTGYKKQLGLEDLDYLERKLQSKSSYTALEKSWNKGR
jgi:ATP-binding cassette, subfamily C (CFTR/MRP), member 1